MAALSQSTPPLPPPPPAHKSQPFWLGGVASMGAACCSHPLDLLKVRLQCATTTTTSVPGGPPVAAAQKEGLVKLISTIIRTDGVLSLYNGLSASLLRQGTYSTVRFGCYEYIKEQRLESLRAVAAHPSGVKDLPMHESIVFSMVSGSIGGVAGNPADLVNVRMQNDRKLPIGERRNYRNVFDGLARIARQDGIASLWNGVGPNVMRAALMTTGQLASYDLFKGALVERGCSDKHIGTHLTASCLAGVVATVITQPVDCVKCWATGTELMMYDGTNKKVEDIVRDSRAGRVQVLMGDDSTPRTVQPGTEHEGVGPLYAVVSGDQARPTWMCNAGHILVLRVDSQPSLRQPSPHFRWQVTWFSLVPGPSDEPAGQRSFIAVSHHRGQFETRASADQFAADLKWQPLEFECTVSDYLGMSPEARTACTMFSPPRVDFGQSGASLQTRLQAAVKEFGATDLVVSDELVRQTAWVLGVWLTDGDERAATIAQIAACRQSPEHAHTAVVRELEDWYAKVYGVDVTTGVTAAGQPSAVADCLVPANQITWPQSVSTGGSIIYTIHLGQVLTALLRSYKLEGHKHILPQDLLTESATVRQALLEGILDGAGSLREGHAYALPNESRDFLASVQHLARGLGLSTGQIGKQAIALQQEQEEQNRAYVGYSIDITGVDLSSLKLVLAYKRCPAAAKVVSPSHDPRSAGFSIVRASPGTFWGFELDGNCRCLLGDFVVTHNTRMMNSGPASSPSPCAGGSVQAPGGPTVAAGRTRDSAMAVVRRMVAAEGPQALFKGFVPALTRLGPHTIATFIFLEQLKRLVA